LSFFLLLISFNLAGNRTIMAKKIINIDGYIGDGGFSAQYIKNALAGASNDEIELRINSLGGDVGHAIAIKDALQAHGNVTALYSGASASSGTIISMGCKKVLMTKDSFFLVHKPMVGIDIWATLNEDQLKDLIAKLTGQLDNATKFTLQIAGMYCDKTGKPAREMLDIMKKGAWLNAEETKNLGFVDEIITPDQITNYLEDEKLVALIAGNDMPPLPRKINVQQPIVVEDVATKIEKAGNTFLENLKNFFSNHTKNHTEMSKPNVYALVCALLAVEAIELTDEGVFLNKEQLDKIEAEIKKLQGEKITAETNLATANTSRETAVNALSAATAAMDELDATVKAAETSTAKVEAIRKKLAEKPGAAATGAQNSSDQTKKKIEGADEVTDYVKTIV
jgi:ATP-dependent Clp protease protease subunit